MHHVWTQSAEQFNQWDLFQKSKKIDGYAAVIKSAFQAAEKLFKSEGLVFDELDYYTVTGMPRRPPFSSYW